MIFRALVIVILLLLIFTGLWKLMSSTENLVEGAFRPGLKDFGVILLKSIIYLLVVIGAGSIIYALFMTFLNFMNT
jgi:hypothetical protein